jgi:hypothetical protein
MVLRRKGLAALGLVAGMAVTAMAPATAPAHDVSTPNGHAPRDRQQRRGDHQRPGADHRQQEALTAYAMVSPPLTDGV